MNYPLKQQGDVTKFTDDHINVIQHLAIKGTLVGIGSVCTTDTVRDLVQCDLIIKASRPQSKVDHYLIRPDGRKLLMQRVERDQKAVNALLTK